MKMIRLAALGALGLLISGCGEAGGGLPCSPSDEARGYVCYRGINFGQSSDPLYRSGVRDGCDTGRGTFRKSYRLWASSEAYRKGWIQGRTICRPPAAKSTSKSARRSPSSPAPSTRRHAQESERPVIRAFPEEQHRSSSPSVSDTPEVLNYD